MLFDRLEALAGFLLEHSPPHVPEPPRALAQPPYGSSKMSVARNARAAHKAKAKRRARKLGHA